MEGVKRRKMSHEAQSPQTRTSTNGLALPKYAEDDDEEEEEVSGDGGSSDEESESQTAAGTPAPQPSQQRDAASQAHQTNLSTLNDPVAIAGVDLAAEEEAIREGNRRQPGPYVAPTGRAAPINFVNKEELQKRVTKTASEGSMKTLKADTLDIISAAVQQRLRNLLEKVVAARDHRLRVHATRPPPLDDLDAHPAWDIEVSADVDKILAVMSKVDREEEKTARRSRIAKEEAELQEKQQAEQAQKEGQDGEDGASSRKKREKETSARNLTEDQQKKLTDASTRQMLFGDTGSRYSWLQGPAGGSSAPSGSMKPLPLPSLPNGAGPSLLGGSPSSAVGTPTASGGAGTPGLPSSALNLPNGGKFGGGQGATADGDAADPSVPLPGKVIWQDVQYALQQERGHGAGQGSGSQSVLRAGLFRGSKASQQAKSGPY